MVCRSVAVGGAAGDVVIGVVSSRRCSGRWSVVGGGVQRAAQRSAAERGRWDGGDWRGRELWRAAAQMMWWLVR